jgi:alkylated DNA repair dioxygenase AlkB
MRCHRLSQQTNIEESLSTLKTTKRKRCEESTHIDSPIKRHKSAAWCTYPLDPSYSSVLPQPTAVDDEGKRNSEAWIDVFTVPTELACKPSSELFKSLVALWPEEPTRIMMFGSEMDAPRRMTSYGRGYHFRGTTHGGEPVPEVLQPYLDWMNGIERYGGKFNQVMVNWYKEGSEYIGKHSDDTKQLIPNSPIGLISLGQERTFRVKPKKTRTSTKPATKPFSLDIPTTLGKVIVMGGTMQNHYTHEIPKVGGKKGQQMGMRIGLTFRQFKE